jgi:hypothetical protein
MESGGESAGCARGFFKAEADEVHGSTVDDGSKAKKRRQPLSYYATLMSSWGYVHCRDRRE